MKSPLLCIYFGAALVLGASGVGAAESIYGVYETDFTRMTIEPGPNGRIAKYTHNNGRIFGTVEGTLMRGFWVEQGLSEDSQKCDSEKDGSYYWGGVAYSFSPDFSKFKGSWSFCNGTLDNGWSGIRVEDDDAPVDILSWLRNGADLEWFTAAGN